jgi:hypothetical protein
MPEHVPQPPVTEADAVAIACHNGLMVPPERVPKFAKDLAGVRELIAEMDRVALPQPPAPPGAYDPAWPDTNGTAR